MIFDESLPAVGKKLWQRLGSSRMFNAQAEARHTHQKKSDVCIHYTERTSNIHITDPISGGKF